MKLIKRFFKWYFNQQAKFYEDTFHGRVDIPWWM